VVYGVFVFHKKFKQPPKSIFVEEMKY